VDITEKEDSEEEFRTVLSDILKKKLSSEMQKKIVDGVEITPEEVQVFQKIPAADLPFFGVELK
jgi:peptidyl-prolyl cis-trans isomerase SurA